MGNTNVINVPLEIFTWNHKMRKQMHLFKRPLTMNQANDFRAFTDVSLFVGVSYSHPQKVCSPQEKYMILHTRAEVTIGNIQASCASISENPNASF